MLRPEVMVPDQALLSDEGRLRRTAHGLAWTRPMLAAGFFVGVLALLVRMAAAPLSNTDTYFHLRFGSEFLHHWSLRHPGSVSSYATAHWLPTQWLPEMVMARTQEWVGLAGVAWLSGVQMVALMTTLYLVARRWVDPLLAAVLMAAGIVAASTGLSMRPQVLSFLFIAITVAAWMRTREDGRVRWWLVPMTWVWAMVHGMWPIGIGLGVVAVAGMALDRTRTRAELGKALLVPFLSAVVAALTPVGPGLYGAVLDVGARSQFFSEWGTPRFTTFRCLLLAVMLAAAIVLFVRRGRATWFDLAFLLTAAACAVWSWRTVPVASVMLVPLIAAHALPRSGQGTTTSPGRRELGLVSGAVALGLTVLAVIAPVTSGAPAQPSWVDPALSSLPVGTPVLSDWAYAGYLMWKYPGLDMVMHGYGDTYTVPELERNQAMLTLGLGWDSDVRATQARVAVLRPTYRLAYQLEHQEGWQVVHRSPTLEMLVAPPGWPAPSS